MSIEPLSKEKHFNLPNTASYILEASPSDHEGSSTPIESSGHIEHHNNDPATLAAIEKSLVRKLDLRILPMAGFAYFLLFLDRSNIGNARIAGLEKDLGLTGYDFNIGACLFYVMYMLAEVPFSLVIKKFGFIFVPIMIIFFGVITLVTTWLTNRSGFFAIRCLLGLGEAATMPGLAYLLSRYYRRTELTARIGFFMLSAAGTAQAFGGLLSSGLLSVGNIGSVKTWRTIFLVEGMLTIVFGIIMLWLFPSDIATTKMLTEPERQIALRRLAAEGPSGTRIKEKTSSRLIYKAFFNVNTVACTYMYICDNITVQGLSIFTPTILRLNYPGSSTVKIQLLSVAPAIVAAIVALTCCYVAMRTRSHGFVTIFGASLSVIGYGIWAGTNSSAIKVRYFAIFLNTASGFIYGPVVVGWAVSNASPDTVRAMTSAVVTGLGCIGSIAATWSYIPLDAKTGYKIGNYLNCCTGASVILVSCGLMAYQRFENRLRDRGGRDYRFQEERQEELGFHHPDFRYVH